MSIIPKTVAYLNATFSPVPVPSFVVVVIINLLHIFGKTLRQKNSLVENNTWVEHHISSFIAPSRVHSVCVTPFITNGNLPLEIRYIKRRERERERERREKYLQIKLTMSRQATLVLDNLRDQSKNHAR
jgi:hypothetical protein